MKKTHFMGQCITFSCLFPLSIAIAAPLGTMDPSQQLILAPGEGNQTSSSDLAGVTSGLKSFYRKFGKYRLSVDAAGSNGVSHNIKVKKPTNDAVVEKAFLLAASYGFSSSHPINDGDISLRNSPITWNDSYAGTAGGVVFYNVRADVTSIVAGHLDSKARGTYNYKVRELSGNTNIDGEILVVVFKIPSLKASERRTIALMFGGQQSGGDRFELSLAAPIETSSAGGYARMGLGISFGYQEGGTGQYSTVTVNGNQITSSAGGNDDGADLNGALITVGGLNDQSANPSDPYATPTTARDDDEYYNLLPSLTDTDTSIIVNTVNPSFDDNILFSWFELSEKADINVDTDGDGLLDSWEESGYDHDGDGVIDVDLPGLGFDPKKKDIAIAYAWMKKGPNELVTHKPMYAERTAVKNAFANAPVQNPDGSTGIKLHWKPLGGVPHDDDLNPVWTEFDSLMDPLLTEAERVVYHRMLSGHGYSGGGSSGLSRGLPASDFIETLGVFSSNPGTMAQRAGTIMHELGHNLGLRHGGPDHTNYKPNHLSVMSYLNQFDWLIKNKQPLLDFERFKLKNLNETKLNEVRGLDMSVGSESTLREYGVRYSSGSNATLQKNRTANKSIDWNNNNNNSNKSVSVDINRDGTQGVLNAKYSEWDNIVYTGGSIGGGVITSSSAGIDTLDQTSDALKEPELTEEMYLEMKKNMIEVVD